MRLMAFPVTVDINSRSLLPRDLAQGDAEEFFAIMVTGTKMETAQA